MEFTGTRNQVFTKSVFQGKNERKRKEKLSKRSREKMARRKKKWQKLFENVRDEGRDKCLDGCTGNGDQGANFCTAHLNIPRLHPLVCAIQKVHRGARAKPRTCVGVYDTPNLLVWKPSSHSPAGTRLVLGMCLTEAAGSGTAVVACTPTVRQRYKIQSQN